MLELTQRLGAGCAILSGIRQGYLALCVKRMNEGWDLDSSGIAGDAALAIHDTLAMLTHDAVMAWFETGVDTGQGVFTYDYCEYDPSAPQASNLPNFILNLITDEQWIQMDCGWWPSQESMLKAVESWWADPATHEKPAPTTDYREDYLLALADAGLKCRVAAIEAFDRKDRVGTYARFLPMVEDSLKLCEWRPRSWPTITNRLLDLWFSRPDLKLGDRVKTSRGVGKVRGWERYTYDAKSGNVPCVRKSNGRRVVVMLDDGNYFFVPMNEEISHV